jgi:hypothetical protein
MWVSLYGSPILAGCTQIKNGKNNTKLAYSSWNDWSRGYYESAVEEDFCTRSVLLRVTKPETTLREANNIICLHTSPAIANKIGD